MRLALSVQCRHGVCVLRRSGQHNERRPEVFGRDAATARRSPPLALDYRRSVASVAPRSVLQRPDISSLFGARIIDKSDTLIQMVTDPVSVRFRGDRPMQIQRRGRGKPTALDRRGTRRDNMNDGSRTGDCRTARIRDGTARRGCRPSLLVWLDRTRGSTSRLRCRSAGRLRRHPPHFAPGCGRDRAANLADARALGRAGRRRHTKAASAEEHRGRGASRLLKIPSSASKTFSRTSASLRNSQGE